MTLKLPLSAGQWNSCTYARPFLPLQGMVEGRIPPSELFDVLARHNEGAAPNRVEVLAVASGHHFIPGANGTRHAWEAIDLANVRRLFFLGVEGETLLLGAQMRTRAGQGSQTQDSQIQTPSSQATQAQGGQGQGGQAQGGQAQGGQGQDGQSQGGQGQGGQAQGGQAQGGQGQVSLTQVGKVREHGPVSKTDSRPGLGDLRRVVGQLSPTDMQLLATLSGLVAWHDSAAFCARCGQRTRFDAGGWQRRCDQCDHVEYPRTDPSIIVAIYDHEDRLLLAHNKLWRPNYASLVAGFMEMGESPEQAVVRETREEVGLYVGDVSYVASQAWPFPRSLMLGYEARLRNGTRVEPRVDGIEMGWARFYSRSEFANAIEANELEAPGPISIARAMIRRWYGSLLPDEQPDG